MTIALWIVSGLLAAAYLMAGATKAFQSRESLQPKMAYVEDFSAGTVKAIGTLEVLAALGLILPEATGILTWLTPTAAIGLVLVQIGAIIVHLRRGETKLAMNVVLLLAAAFLAVFRLLGF
jgi:hypothetical protein